MRIFLLHIYAESITFAFHITLRTWTLLAHIGPWNSANTKTFFALSLANSFISFVAVIASQHRKQKNVHIIIHFFLIKKCVCSKKRLNEHAIFDWMLEENVNDEWTLIKDTWRINKPDLLIVHCVGFIFAHSSPLPFDFSHLHVARSHFSVACYLDKRFRTQSPLNVYSIFKRPYRLKTS